MLFMPHISSQRQLNWINRKMLANETEMITRVTRRESFYTWPPFQASLDWWPQICAVAPPGEHGFK